jgi:predicted  nucleic acid-binding Zn-ribbon protein
MTTLSSLREDIRDLDAQVRAAKVRADSARQDLKEAADASQKAGEALFNLQEKHTRARQAFALLSGEPLPIALLGGDPQSVKEA